MPINHPTLEQFQATLLEVLADNTRASDIRAVLSSSPTIDPALLQWIQESPDAMLETAAVLVKKWGIRKTHDATGRY